MLKILSCTNNKKQGKAGESEADHPSSITCPSQVSSQLLAKRFILNFFQQIFLSRDLYMYDWATGRDLMNGHPKLMSRRQFASVGERAWCIVSSTVGGSLGPLIDHDKVCQKIEHPAVYATQIADIHRWSPVLWCFSLFIFLYLALCVGILRLIKINLSQLFFRVPTNWICHLILQSLKMIDRYF